MIFMHFGGREVHLQPCQECPKLSPTKLVALTSPAVFVFGLLLAVSIEGLAPWRRLPWLDVRCSALLAFSALCAVFLSIMGALGQV